MRNEKQYPQRMHYNFIIITKDKILIKTDIKKKEKKNQFEPENI